MMLGNIDQAHHPKKFESKENQAAWNNTKFL